MSKHNGDYLHTKIRIHKSGYTNSELANCSQYHPQDELLISFIFEIEVPQFFLSGAI